MIAAARAPIQLVRHPRDFAIIARRVIAQTLVRPLVFYAIVSTLIGYTVLFVISKVGGAGVRPDALLRQPPARLFVQRHRAPARGGGRAWGHARRDVRLGVVYRRLVRGR